MPSSVCPSGTESTIAVHLSGASEENLRGIWLRVGDTGHVRTTASCSCCEAPDTPLFQVWSRPTPRSPLYVHYHFRQCLLKQLEETTNCWVLYTQYIQNAKCTRSDILHVVCTKRLPAITKYSEGFAALRRTTSTASTRRGRHQRASPRHAERSQHGLALISTIQVHS